MQQFFRFQLDTLTVLVTGALTLAAAVALFAQEVPTFSVNVKVVNVLATVRDKHGKIVNNLTQNDFMLQEDGRPQAIKYFRQETDMPLTLGLLVDTSLSQLRVLDKEKTASAAFTNDVLRADRDAAFLIHFDEEVELLQDLTKSPMKMQSALEEIQPPRNAEHQMGGGNPGGGYPGGGGGGGRSGRGHRGGGGGVGTLLYDSVYLASNELMQKQQGRKAVIVLTDGDDRGSKMSLDEAIESAQRADTMVYSIYFADAQEGFMSRGRIGGMGGPWGGGGRGGGWPGGGGQGGGGGYPRASSHSEEGKKVLERLSRETGGRMFAVSKNESITDIYAQIQDELRNQYNLGYSPDRKAADASDYRHIKVETKQKDLIVQAREGYYASKQDEAKGQPGQ